MSAWISCGDEVEEDRRHVGDRGVAVISWSQQQLQLVTTYRVNVHQG